MRAERKTSDCTRAQAHKESVVSRAGGDKKEAKVLAAEAEKANRSLPVKLNQSDSYTKRRQDDSRKLISTGSSEAKGSGSEGYRR